MIKVSDYIVKRLEEYGVRQVFMITGGGAMHLNDSVGRSKVIEYLCSHHEQASAIGAEGYSRLSGRLGVVVVTSGPGGTNTLTGVIGQWLDSVPALYISGQVKQETTIESCRELGLRQLGDQEINITDIVRPVTKFAAIVKKPADVRMLLEKAVYIAMHGRPGPVWLDVPLDIQGAMVDESSLTGYEPGPAGPEFSTADAAQLARDVVGRLKNSKRPVVLAGHGVRIAGAQGLLSDFVEKAGIPVVTSFCGADLIASEHPLFMGRVGTIGTRSGNFTLQNADLLISIGSRNNIRQVSYNWASYARSAYKIMVDIDGAELNKPTVKPDMAVHCDAFAFLEGMLGALGDKKLPDWGWWQAWCRERKERYPAVREEWKASTGLVNPYYFIDQLTSRLKEDAVVVAGNGTACVALFQAGRVKQGQRFFWNSGCASMGYDLPAAIGACLANGKKDVICLAGDGSLQMNIQELQTVAHNRLPVKLFVLNNEGYISIRQTQDAFFEGRYVGCGPSCGVCVPDVSRIASAYCLPSVVIEGQGDVGRKIEKVLDTPGPVVCDVRLAPDYKFEPKLSSERLPDGRMVSKPLEDMFPFLDREEFKSNMLVPEWEP